MIGGGAMLQPVLYSLAVEQALGTPVHVRAAVLLHVRRRLRRSRDPAQRANRRAGLEALEIVDRAIELGFLPAAPAERACTWCDFRPVCGPHDEQRASAQDAREAGRSRRR